jgi:hypothetical protein
LDDGTIFDALGLAVAGFLVEGAGERETANLIQTRFAQKGTKSSSLPRASRRLDSGKFHPIVGCWMFPINCR